MTQTTLGAKLRFYRKRAGLSLQTAARLTLYEKSSISKFETHVPSEIYVARFIEISQLKLSEAEKMEILSLSDENIWLHSNSLKKRRTVWAGEPVPETSSFYGREESLKHLTRVLIEDRCQLVGVFGIGGIGKTSLVAKLARSLESEFDCIFWQSLVNTPYLKDVLREFLQFMPAENENVLYENTSALIHTAIKVFGENRCLLIFDNYDSILQGESFAGNYRSQYEDYGQFLQQIAQVKHQSCILLTSREKPKEVFLTGNQPLMPQSYAVKAIEFNAAYALMKECLLRGSDEAFFNLANHFSGNPLALRLVSNAILEIHNGNIDDFLAKGQAITGDVSDVLDMQLARLSEIELDVIYWLTIERQATTIAKIKSEINQPISVRDLENVFLSLLRRSIVESASEKYFILPNVIMEHMTARLIRHVYQEIDGGNLKKLHSHLILQVQAKDYIRDAQRRVIVRPVLDEMTAIWGERDLEKHLLGLLNSLRGLAAYRTQYAGGNLLNLLVCLGSNLNKMDLSRLVIRQAFLQETSFCDANLSEADVSGSVFMEPSGEVLSVSYSPDGKILASSNVLGEISLWDSYSGVRLKIWRAHENWVRKIAFSPDGQLLASCGDDRLAKIWQLENQKCIQVLEGHTSWVRTLAFHPQGKYLATGSDDGMVRFWDVGTGKCSHFFYSDSVAIHGISFNPDGSLLVTAGNDGAIKVWRVDSGNCIQTLIGHERQVDAIAFSPNGSMIASASHDWTVRLWDFDTGNCNRIMRQHTDRVDSLSFSPDGRWLASGDNGGTLYLSNAIDSEETQRRFQGHSDLIRSVCFHTVEPWLVSGGTDRTIRIWDTLTGRCDRVMAGYNNPIYAQASHPDDRILVSAGQTGQIYFWNWATGEYLYDFTEHSLTVWVLDFSLDGKWLVSGSGDHTVILWNLEAGRISRKLQGHSDEVRSIAFSPDAQKVVSGDHAGVIFVWSLNGDCYGQLSAHLDRVYKLAFTPDGMNFISVSADRTAKIWDAQTLRCIHTIDFDHPIFSLDISPNGKYYAMGLKNGVIHLLDVSTNQSMQFLSGNDEAIWGLAFSPDGQQLASASEDHTVCVWDLMTKERIHILKGHQDIVNEVAFNKNGTVIASSSDDGTTMIWNAQTGDRIRTLLPDRPYERMNIKDIIGLTDAQKSALKSLGAIE